MQIRGHVGGETRRGRRSAEGLHGEVVVGRLPHAQVPEVEILLAEGVGAKERLGCGQVASEASPVSAWNRGWVHGGEGRGHFHGGGGGGRFGWVVPVTLQTKVALCLDSMAGVEAATAHCCTARVGRAISIQDEKTNSNLKMLAGDSLKPGQLYEEDAGRVVMVSQQTWGQSRQDREVVGGDQGASSNCPG